MHYRVSLRVRGRKSDLAEKEREVHKDNPRLDTGMHQALRAHPRRASVLITICWTPDDECPHYKPKGP